MPGIGVILNPHSKRYLKSPHKLEMMNFIVGERGDFRATQDLEAVETVIKKFCDQEIEVLALSGGDGTNHRTLTALLQHYGDRPLPRIALLRGGTLNTVAAACGIKGAPEKILLKLIECHQRAEPMHSIVVYPMKINDRYGFIWGCGVIARFMEAYYAKGIPSPAHAAWTLVHSVSSALMNGRFASTLFARTDATITVNGELWPFANYSAIYAGAINQLGFNFRVFHYAGSDKAFHAIAFSTTPRHVLHAVPRMYCGRPSGCEDLLEAPAQEMEVQLKQPLSYTIDGDMYEPEDYFLLRTGPKLEILVP